MLRKCQPYFLQLVQAGSLSRSSTRTPVFVPFSHTGKFKTISSCEIPEKKVWINGMRRFLVDRVKRHLEHNTVFMLLFILQGVHLQMKTKPNIFNNFVKDLDNLFKKDWQISVQHEKNTQLCYNKCALQICIIPHIFVLNEKTHKILSMQIKRNNSCWKKRDLANE